VDAGGGADAIWMALGTTVRNTNVDFNQGAFAFYGLRRLGSAADLTVGMRVNTRRGSFVDVAIAGTAGYDRRCEPDCRLRKSARSHG
jgi:hypothetical protein